MSSFYDDASLVVIPSGYKTSKVYAEKPTDGSGDLAFTRTGDTATRVNSAGLIEKVRTNLFLYSEQFNNTAAWQYQSSPIISANASVAPDGTTTADLLYPSVNGSIVAAIQAITSASSVEYTQSVYVKASGKNFVALYTFDGTTGTAMWVNLTTGEITNGVGPNVSNRFATNVGNGWWRIGFTDIGNGTTTYMHVYPTDAASSNSVTASGTDGILLWGAQLETGVATAYIKTTSAAVSVGPVANVPRLDYLGSTCGKLLLEPQRTNLKTYSEDGTGTKWGNPYQVSVTANQTASPDGYVNADSVADTANNTPHRFEPNFNATNETAYTFSYFAKANTLTQCHIYGFTDNFVFSGQEAIFNLSNGTVVSNTGGGTAAITPYGNGWYRVSLTLTANATSLGYWGFGPAKNGAVGYLGNGSSLYMWGVQLEAGAYATSYIPTLATSATRGEDACSKTGISSLIGQTEGTVFFEFTYDTVSGQTNGAVLWYMKDGGTGERYIQLFDDGRLIYIEFNGAVIANITKTGVTAGRHKCAVAYANNDMVLYVDGVQAGTDTSGTPSGFSTFGIQYYTTIFNGQQKVNQALVFKTRLTNAQMQELTTL